MKKNNARFRTAVFWLCGLFGLYLTLLAVLTSTLWPLILFIVAILVLFAEESLISWLEKRRLAAQQTLPAEPPHKHKPGVHIDSDGEIPEQADADLEISDEPLSLNALLKGESGTKIKNHR